MNAIVLGLGYLTLASVCFLIGLACVDYGRRRWKAKAEAKAKAEREARWATMADAVMRSVTGPMESDYVRPMGVRPIEHGWIAESRFHVDGASDAEVIENLMREAR